MKLGPATSTSSRAFSLIEVLLAMFILGIGLIMVASIFPVGADWTRQTVEDSVSQSISRTALSVIQSHYGPGGDRNTDLLKMVPPNATVMPVNVTNAGVLQPLPHFSQIPISERCYLFGSSSPFPVTTGPPDKTIACTYFWTALWRLSPGQFDSSGNLMSSTSYKYDIYIFVFHKGDISNQFSTLGGNTEVSGVMIPGDTLRNLSAATPETFVPTLVSHKYDPGIYNAKNLPSITGAIPPIGTIGVDTASGTVFRQSISAIGSAAIARPALGDPTVVPYTGTIIYAPPADNTNSGSPLVYVYQTTLSF